MIRPGLHAFAALAYGAVFIAVVLYLGFDLPRFDYWDVVYASLAVSDPSSLVIYLFTGNESMMAVPKLFIYLSNMLGAGKVFLVERIVTLLFGIGAHLLLLRVLHLPLVPHRDAAPGTALRWWVVLALFWWPAVVPTHTNTWFAVQYGLTLFFGLLATHAYQTWHGGPMKPVYCYTAWLAAAASHGTGLLLGPVLAVLAIARHRRWYFGLVLIVSTALIMWIQHESSRGVAHNILRLESPWSLGALRFMVRVITPPMWETALFILVVAPLLCLTAWLYATRGREYVDKPYTPLIFWGLVVWLAIWLARGGFQTHANPHYLRFFVVLYAAWAMLLLDWLKTGSGRTFAAGVGGALTLVVWLKGAGTGIEQAAVYRDQIQAGSAVLRGESDDTAALCHLYPDGDRLVGVLLPPLTGTLAAYRGLAAPRAPVPDCGWAH